MHSFIDYLKINASWISDSASVIFSIIGTTIAILVYIGAKERFFPRRDKKLIGYRAVFLTNGQVYFGRVTEFDHEYIKLVEIYYLQTVENPNDINPLSLVKLGNELHGPDDAMYINRSQVLYWEDIKEHGEVMKAIINYKQENKK